AVEGDPITLQRLFAYAFRPVMWLIGIPGEDTAAAATLMGTKTVLNEFIAYVDLAHLPPEAMSQRARLIMTYAMCGFANFGSLGILIGGMGAMVPERRAEIVSLGLRSILSGTIATCMSGAVVSLLRGAEDAERHAGAQRGDLLRARRLRHEPAAPDGPAFRRRGIPARLCPARRRRTHLFLL